MKRAIFLDADGVLNKAILRGSEPSSPFTLAELEIPDEVHPALTRLKAAGFLLICVTNKPDVEEGSMTQANLDAIIRKLRDELPLDHVCICYLRKSDCYKPKPGLLLDAAQKHGIDLSQSFMIGDTWRDIGAGHNAGCKAIWINRHYPHQTIPSPKADFTALSLSEAVDWILA